MNTVTNISIDLTQPQAPNVVHAKQNDRLTRWIYVELTAGAIPFVPPVGAAAIIRIKKRDGTALFYDSDENNNPAVLIDGNVIQCLLVEQALADYGMAQAEINLYTAEGERVTSFLFYINTEKSVLDDATIVSSDYINILTATLAQMLETEQSVKDAVAQYPVIQTGTWWTWDVAQGGYVDTGQPAQGATGQPGENATITIGATTTLPAGSAATVENTGTDNDAVLNFGIPEGVAGIGDGYTEYTHVKSGTVHALTSTETNSNVKFLATADFENGDTFTINGTEYTSQTTDGAQLPSGYFVSGAVVTCFASGTVLNFKSGGSALNFRVYGAAALPDTGTENDIFIVTDDSVTGWLFSAQQPEGIEGLVWIKTGAQTSYEFNALKTNGVIVYPISCIQYTSGEWVQKYGHIMLAGEWVGLGAFYLDKSNKFQSITGGYLPLTGIQVGNGVVYIPGTETTSGLLLDCTTQLRCASMGTVEPVDFTNLSTINFLIDVTDTSGTTYSVDVGLSKTRQINATNNGQYTWAGGVHTQAQSAGLGIIKSFDVSGLTGQYYIVMGAVAGSSTVKVLVRQIWGE